MLSILAQTGSAGANAIQFWIAMVLVAAGLGLILLVGVTFLRNRGSSDAGDYVAGSATNYASVGTTQEAERLLRLMGEAEELCTRLANQLDDKAQQIERLLARSDATLASGASPAQSEPLPARPGARPEIVTRPMPVSTPVAAGPVAPAGSGIAPQAAASPYYSAPAPMPATTAPKPQPAPVRPMPAAAPQAAAAMSQDAISEQIFKLADSGIAPAEIAKRLNQHTGKVELILALRNA